MAYELDMEWRFGDAGQGALGIEALASYNPMRWSGSLDLRIGFKQMEELKENGEGHRPIILKIPSGITAREHLCKDVTTAMEHIKTKSPEHIKAELEELEAQERKRRLLKVVQDNIAELESAKISLQQEQDKAKEARTSLHDLIAEVVQQNGVQCQWMFDDAGSGWGVIGLGDVGGKLAHLNPARWSQKNSMPTTQDMLEAVARDVTKCDRPILLKIHEQGKNPQETKFAKVDLAIAYLRTVMCTLHPELKPLESAHEDAEHRLRAAKTQVHDAEKMLKDSQKQAKAAGALD